MRTKEELETTVTNIKNWMDTMYLELNSDKTEYMKYGSGQQLQKSANTLLNANGNLVNLSEVVRYLGGYLDQTLSFKEHIKQKNKERKGNLH